MALKPLDVNLQTIFVNTEEVDYLLEHLVQEDIARLDKDVITTINLPECQDKNELCIHLFFHLNSISNMGKNVDHCFNEIARANKSDRVLYTECAQRHLASIKRVSDAVHEAIYNGFYKTI